MSVTASSGSGSANRRSCLPTMTVFSPNCGTQFRVVCNWECKCVDAAAVGTTNGV